MRSSTGSGKAAGPALKLKARLVGRGAAPIGAGVVKLTARLPLAE